MVFKIDFEKAFDSTSCSFLDEVMRQMNFGCKWRGWISGCLKSAFVSILINGSPFKEFSMGEALDKVTPWRLSYSS